MNYDSQLEELAKRLGADAAARLDVEATARKVVQRLKAEPVQRSELSNLGTAFAPVLDQRTSSNSAISVTSPRRSQ